MDNSELRPTRLSEVVGQEALVSHLRILLGGAKHRKEAAPHILFAGPPGLGKTTFAETIANEMGTRMVPVFGPTLTQPADLAGLLLSLEEGDVLFIDEIHALKRQVEEVLYPAVEDFHLDIVIGKGPDARTVRIDLPHFTLIGATTLPGRLSRPMLDRFVSVENLDFYSPAELAGLVERSGRALGVIFTVEAAREVANRSKGTPRVANQLVRLCRDWKQSQGSYDDIIEQADVQAALELFGIDCIGLDTKARAILEALCVRFHGNPVGLTTLAAATGEDVTTIESMHEPYLLREGFLTKTPRGRQATPAAFEHLGLPVPLAAL
jgi:Holliday junction DNA helicase RuvB